MASAAVPDPDRETWIEWEIKLRAGTGEVRASFREALEKCWDGSFKHDFRRDIARELRLLHDFEEVYEANKQEVDAWDYEDPYEDVDAVLAEKKAAYLAYGDAAADDGKCLAAVAKVLARGPRECGSSLERVEDLQEELRGELDAYRSRSDTLAPETVIAVREEAREFRGAREREAALGRNWVGSWQLGLGSYGSVRLWVKQNRKGLIVDRVAIKDTGPSCDEHGEPILSSRADRTHPGCLWEDGVNYWYPPRHHETPLAYSRSTLIEVLAPYKLRGRIGSENIVTLRNWRLDTPRHHLRLYQEFCPFSDMHDVFISSPRRPHNESMLWHTFESLCRVGILFERGTLDTHAPAPQLDPGGETWPLIVHRDWKPANLMLAPALRDRWRGFPTPKVGDFGLALMIGPRDRRAPAEFDLAGTPGCRAPEVAGEVVEGTWTAVTKPGSWTDVYGVGMVLWSLMHRVEGDARLSWEQGWMEVEDRPADTGEGLARESGFTREVEEEFSAELVGLVRRCIRYRVADRPTFRWVLRRIQRVVGSDVRAAEGSLRDAGADDPRFREGMWVGEEKWPLYSLLAKVQPRVLGRRPAKAGPKPSRDGRGRSGADSDDDDDDDDDDDEDGPPGGQPGAELRSPSPRPPPKQARKKGRGHGGRKGKKRRKDDDDNDDGGGGGGDGEGDDQAPPVKKAKVASKPPAKKKKKDAPPPPTDRKLRSRGADGKTK